MAEIKYEVNKFHFLLDELQDSWEAWRSLYVHPKSGHAQEVLREQARQRYINARKAVIDSYRVSLEALEGSNILLRLATLDKA